LNAIEVKTNSLIDEKVFMQKLDPKTMDQLPSSGEKVMTLVKTLSQVYHHKMN